MQEGWRLFEWWLKQQAAADHAWVMDLLWTNSISVHILGLALFCICFCIPANLLYVVKINLGACFTPCIVLFCLLWTNSIYAHILQPSSIFVFFFVFFPFKTNLLWTNSIYAHILHPSSVFFFFDFKQICSGLTQFAHILEKSYFLYFLFCICISYGLPVIKINVHANTRSCS